MTALRSELVIRLCAIPEKGIKNEDLVRPHGLSMERRQRFGVYFILKSMEQGPTFRSVVPKYPTDDPDYRILKRNWSRYTHYYFYIRDEVLGPMILCKLHSLLEKLDHGHHGPAGVLQKPGGADVRKNSPPSCA